MKLFCDFLCNFTLDPEYVLQIADRIAQPRHVHRCGYRLIGRSNEATNRFCADYQPIRERLAALFRSARMSRAAPGGYCITLVRLMTLRSRIFANFVKNDRPECHRQKTCSSLSWLRFSNGNTAMPLCRKLANRSDFPDDHNQAAMPGLLKMTTSTP